MSNPNPALVTQRGARRLPRIPLLLLCAAYVLPGLFGRDPWRNADLLAFGQMAALAEGRSSWWAPTLGGVPVDSALLPHWLGATFIWLLSPVMDAALAARLPFAALLGMTLALVWYATYHLARTQAAQPLPFAFGGEAEPVDYARAIADGALLALMATLGLLQLGHETTPEMLQLFAVALFLYGLAAAPQRPQRAGWVVVAAVPLLASSGAPTMALVMGTAGAIVCWRSRLPGVPKVGRWVAAATVLGALVALEWAAWRWRAQPVQLADLPVLARQWLWFMWPALPMAVWTLWRWRFHLTHRHLSVPLVALLTALAANVTMNGSDRALLLGLPGLAALAAFALPTLKRSASAAVDWFSMFFFSGWAIVFWVHYVAMQTGVPPKPAANIARLAAGYEPRFALLPLLLALAGTAAWLALVRWRTGRHRDALWKSLVLPAGGVALCWLLAMTLLLPPLDHVRSPRLAVATLAPHVPAGSCVAAVGVALPMVAALEHFGRWTVDARPDASTAMRCETLLRVNRKRPLPPEPAGWQRVAEVTRPTERDEVTEVFRRAPGVVPLPSPAVGRGAIVPLVMPPAPAR